MICGLVGLVESDKGAGLTPTLSACERCGLSQRGAPRKASATAGQLSAHVRTGLTARRDAVIGVGYHVAPVPSGLAHSPPPPLQASCIGFPCNGDM